MEPAIKLDRIGQIAPTVEDLSRATAFFRDQLGMQFLFEAPPHLAFFNCGCVRLMLTLPEDEGETAGANAVLYFTVSDLEAAYTMLSAKGVTFVDAPHLIARLDTYDLWMAFFKDSEGNLLGLMSEKSRQ